MPQGGTRVAWPQTLAHKRHMPLRAAHLRFARNESTGGVLHCFVLDCSASMLRNEQLALAKGMLVACFDRAAAAGAEVALICFGGTRADLRFGPAVPRWWNERWLAPVAGGGATPLAHGMATAARLLDNRRRRKPGQQRVLWLITDGRTEERAARPPAADDIVLVDCERAIPALGRCAELARAWNAAYTRPEDLIVQT